MTRQNTLNAIDEALDDLLAAQSAATWIVQVLTESRENAPHVITACTALATSTDLLEAIDALRTLADRLA